MYMAVSAILLVYSSFARGHFDFARDYFPLLVHIHSHVIFARGHFICIWQFRLFYINMAKGHFCFERGPFALWQFRKRPFYLIGWL